MRRLHGIQAAVEDDVGAGNEAGFVGRQEQHSVRQVLGLADTAERHLAPELSIRLTLAETLDIIVKNGSADEGREHDPRPDAAPVTSAILSSTRPVMFPFSPLVVPLADLQVVRPALDSVRPAAISRSLNFCILPLAVRGISSMISSRSGRYGVAVPASLRKQIMSANVK